MKRTALVSLFENQVRFRVPDGNVLDGSVFIGSTEFLPLQVLRDDTQAFNSEFEDWLSLDWGPRQSDLREQILAETDCLQRYEDLCDAVNRRGAIPLVGAGMSMPSGLPAWGDLIRRAVVSVEHDSTRLTDLLAKGQFEDAAQLAADATGGELLNEKIEHLLRLPKDGLVSGPICLLPEVFDDIIVTTNMDEVLEAVYFDYVDDPLPCLKGGEISKYPSKSGRGPLVLKIHGDRTEFETRVLLPMEYDANYGLGGVVRDSLELLYRTKSIVFMGCSLISDRTMRLLEEIRASGAKMPRHFALLELPVNTAERSRRELFLTARGVFPIWYSGSHDDALFALLDGLRVAAQRRTRA